MKRLLLVVPLLVLSGCTQSQDIEQLERRVGNLEKLVKTMAEAQINQMQQSGATAANNVTVPPLCRGDVVVWDQFGNGLTC
jgi:Tfp pilus assembly protein PilP